MPFGTKKHKKDVTQSISMPISLVFTANGAFYTLQI